MGLCVYPLAIHALPGMVEHQLATLDDCFAFWKTNPLFNSEAVAQETIEVIVPNGEIVNGKQQNWTAIIKKGKGKKNTAFTIIHAEIDRNAKGYFFQEFGVKLNAKTHRLIGHSFFGKPPSPETLQAIKALLERKGKHLTDAEIAKKVMAIQTRVYDNATAIFKKFAKKAGYQLSEKKARACVRLIQDHHLLYDLIPGKNSVVWMLHSTEDILENMKTTVVDAIDDPKEQKKDSSKH